MHLKPILMAILAAGALALGTTGIARAHDAAPVDEQCGAQGDQLTDENDDAACDTESADTETSQAGQTGTRTSGETGTVEHGTVPNGQQGDNEGEHED